MLAMQFSKGDSMLLSLLITTSALAQDCDGAALSKDILEMGPHEAAPAYGQLAACDAGAAKKVASKVVPSLIGETDGFAAAVAAIEVGAGSVVMDWMATLQRDEQSRAVRAYGKRCQRARLFKASWSRRVCARRPVGLIVGTVRSRSAALPAPRDC